MHDPKLLRADQDRIKDGVRAKGQDPALVDEWLALDEMRRGLVTEAEGKKADRNAASREIGARRKSGGDARAEEERVRLLGEEISELDERIRELDARLEALSLNIPNTPDPDVPRGEADQNRVMRTWGDPVKHAFSARTHDDLGTALGLFDFERATKMSGPGFAVFTGRGALLERALIQLMIDIHVREHGYTEVSTPFLVKPSAAQGTGQLPKLADDMYRTDQDGLYLIPTAEVSITNLYADETLEESRLPIYHVGYSPCFRREAGSYGKDTKGLTRVHQFDKVEMVKFVAPDCSDLEHESLTANAEAILQRLGLAYRVVLLASGDMSVAAAKCYDLEVWAARAGRWLEVSSCSNFRDFQARRAGIRMRPAAGGKTGYVHTLNGSGLALPRTVIALIENNQTERGSVRIPEPLRPYLGGLAELS